VEALGTGVAAEEELADEPANKEGLTEPARTIAAGEGGTTKTMGFAHENEDVTVSESEEVNDDDGSTELAQGGEERGHGGRGEEDDNGGGAEEGLHGDAEKEPEAGDGEFETEEGDGGRVIEEREPEGNEDGERKDGSGTGEEIGYGKTGEGQRPGEEASVDDEGEKMPGRCGDDDDDEEEDEEEFGTGIETMDGGVERTVVVEELVFHEVFLSLWSAGRGT
jgi:hypothetical protein